MLLFIDTETTGLWQRREAIDSPSQPYLVQLAAILCKPDGTQTTYLNHTIKPDGCWTNNAATTIHGITTEQAEAFGEPLTAVIARFLALLQLANELGDGLLIAHNVKFDVNVMSAAILRCQQPLHTLTTIKQFCTMRALAPIMQLPSKKPGKYKWPTLGEALLHAVPDAHWRREQKHNAMTDAMTCHCIYLVGHQKGWW